MDLLQITQIYYVFISDSFKNTLTWIALWF